MADEGGSSRSYNLRNPAVKRILQEVKEMAKEQNLEFMSMPLEEDIFEWQFAVHGPKDSEFEGGIYHGRITLPSEYPFKPPSFMLLTPSGRFEVQTKICLSISNHHPEHWQPSWSVRTALVALIAFMPTKPNGAIGSLDYTKKERRALAIKSRQSPPHFGSAERQKVIQQIHEAMLQTAPPVPTTPLVEDEPGAPASPESVGKAPGAPQQPAEARAPDTSDSLQPRKVTETPGASSSGGDEEASRTSTARPAAEIQSAANLQPAGQSATIAREAPTAAPTQHERVAAGGAGTTVPAVQRQVPMRPRDVETLQERILSVVAAVLVLAILLILGQKIARAYTGVTFTGSESEL